MSSSNDIVLKILPDGRVLIERSGHEENLGIYEALKSHLKDPISLKNFLFQWDKRIIIQGRSDLCG